MHSGCGEVQIHDGEAVDHLLYNDGSPSSPTQVGGAMNPVQEFAHGDSSEEDTFLGIGRGRSAHLTPRSFV